MKTRVIKILDTTLRDGTQMFGITFSAREKIEIAKKLDALGIDFIEGGFPGSNPRDAEFFERAKKEKWKNAKICAFGATHHRKFSAENDPNLQKIVESGAPVAVIFGKSSRFHAVEILGISPEKNLEIIENSVKFLRSKKIRVIFDAEHFFDGFLENEKYAIATLKAAERGGAENLTLADTNGGALPKNIKIAIDAVQKIIKTPLGIHAHNDGDLAVANSLAAVEAGAWLVQGTINGYGERTGNANLCSIIPNLQLKMGIEVLPPENLKNLTAISHFVADLATQNPRKDLPFVGDFAFSHKGGIHAAAMMKNPKSYQHIDPKTVGNTAHLSVSDLSGRANIRDFLKKHRIDFSENDLPLFLKEIKNRENLGFSFEGAAASLEVLARHFLEKRDFPFEIRDFFVRTGQLAIAHNRDFGLEATVRGFFKKNRHFHCVAGGSGPVNALDRALRKGLLPAFPILEKIQLTDFKVRIIDMNLGTSAKTRVLMESKNEKTGDIFRTVGCSENIIEASFCALFDAFCFAIWREK